LITAILGSPRRRGNSDTLAMEFLRGTAAKGFGHRLIIPTDLDLSPCDGSNRCFADGQCTIGDGMNEIYDEVLGSSLLLIATPVYFMGPPGSLKAFIDRFQAVWVRSAILKEFDPDSAERRAKHRAFALVTAATPDKPSMYRPAISILKAFCNVTGFSYTGDLIAGGLEGPDDAARREDLMRRAFVAGEDFVTP